MTLTLSGGQSQRVGGGTKKKLKKKRKTNASEFATACQKLLERAPQKGGSHFDLDPTASEESDVVPPQQWPSSRMCRIQCDHQRPQTVVRSHAKWVARTSVNDTLAKQWKGMGTMCPLLILAIRSHHILSALNPHQKGH